MVLEHFLFEQAKVRELTFVAKNAAFKFVLVLCVLCQYGFVGFSFRATLKQLCQSLTFLYLVRHRVRPELFKHSSCCRLHKVLQDMLKAVVSLFVTRERVWVRNGDVF